LIELTQILHKILTNNRVSHPDQLPGHRICIRCVLPAIFPGIKFNSDGVCNFCQRFETHKGKCVEDKSRYKQKFIGLLTQLTTLPHLKDRPYDVVLAYSGGKDSTYTLKLLKENFNLRIVAVTFNHGFVAEQALKNIRTVTTALGVDHLMISPSQNLLCQAFRRSIDTNIYPLKALERASSICNTCMNLTKAILLKYTLALGIPLIAYGWSPGQAPIQASVMKWNLSMIRQIRRVMINTFETILDDHLSPFILGEQQLEKMKESEKSNEFFLYNVHPLAFFDYNEGKIFDEIKRLGWNDPEDTDSNSTNCLLNAFASQVHQEKYGFHPYAFEIAGLVREGYISRDAGLAKMSSPIDENIIRSVKERLFITDSP
jgi:tRNA(Ile)-lysidine synthase TilS/MesJ